MLKCLACGVEKDMDIKEPYPNAEINGWITTPVDPLFYIDVQGDADDFRQTLVCHICLIKLDPDMWIGQSCWESLSPITPFNELPPLE